MACAWLCFVACGCVVFSFELCCSVLLCLKVCAVLYGIVYLCLFVECGVLFGLCWCRARWCACVGAGLVWVGEMWCVCDVVVDAVCCVVLLSGVLCVVCLLC